MSKTLKSYAARDLAQMACSDVDALWELDSRHHPEEKIAVVFDDGVLETTSRQTIISAYFWKNYIRYPKTPALKHHHMQLRRIKNDTHSDLLNLVFWDAVDAYDNQLNRDVMAREVYEDTNEYFCDMNERLAAYVVSMSAIDFIELLEHPEIAKANAAVQPNQASINGVYSVIEKVVSDPNDMIGNQIAEPVKSGLLRTGQVNHCIGPRGYLTDTDSGIFPVPILTGYASGVYKIHDSLIESRSAAKALSFADKQLQDSEYFNRRLQLLSASVQHLHMGDCGSTRLIPWRVHARDFKNLLGKYYTLDPTKPRELSRLRPEDKDKVVGQMIHFRSAALCNHPDSTGTCTTCFGDLALSIPANTVLGHACSTTMCQKVTQAVLSVKHQDDISAVGGVEFSPYEEEFMRTFTNPNHVGLSARLKGKRVQLVIQADQAQNLADIHVVDDVRQIPVSTISEISEIRLIVEGKNRESVQIPVAAGNRLASLTHDMLEYIKQRPLNMTADRSYSFDLKEWDVDKPMLELPFRHINMLEYMEAIKRFVDADKKSSKGRTLREYTTVEGALKEFYVLVSSKLSINVAHLEVILKATMIRSEDARDSRLPVAGNKVTFGNFSKTMHQRSMGGALAFEKHAQLIYDISTLMTKLRPDHPLDSVVMR